jgi:acetoin utilization protein AcuB
MIVEEIMNKEVYTLPPDATIRDALQLLKSKKIRHIPVVDDTQCLVGLVTERDVKNVTSSIFQKEIREEILKKPLHSFMKKEVVSGHPLDFVEEIAYLFYENQIGCLPIVRDGKLVGILSETDVLHTFVELTGANQPGSQIEVKVPNKSGILYEVASVIHRRKANILSALVYPDKQDERYKILVFRVQTMNPLELINALKKEGHTVLWPNMPGISQ